MNKENNNTNLYLKFKDHTFGPDDIIFELITNEDNPYVSTLGKLILNKDNPNVPTLNYKLNTKNET